MHAILCVSDRLLRQLGRSGEYRNGDRRENGAGLDLHSPVGACHLLKRDPVGGQTTDGLGDCAAADLTRGRAEDG